MNLTIEIPDELETALKTEAQAQGVSADCYANRVLERALSSASQQQTTRQPFETGYGMWAKYGPAPSAEEIDESRREMFHNFAEDF